MNFIERAFTRLMYGKPDYSIHKNDMVVSKSRSTPIRVVDVNWALRAAAVELEPGSVVVWPVGTLKKVGCANGCIVSIGSLYR